MLKAQPDRPLLTELLLLVALLCCTLAPFWQTIARAAPISKLALLKPMDAVQAPTLCAPWCILDDLSSSMTHIPNELFAQQQGASELPLWNHLNGGGRPFVGEFQTLQFSVFHMLFPAASPYAYNLGILFKILLSATGAYFLARYMKISSWSSFAVGVAFALCPHCLRFTELVDNFCFYPWLALAFVWFGRQASLPRAIAAGLLTAACAYNMHPETFACAAGLSAVLALSELSKVPGKVSFGKACLWIFLIAVTAFCAAAPLVLPLLEFIANGSSYKFAAHQIEHIQFSDFLCALFVPLASGSSYIGLILGLSLPLGLVVWWRRFPLLLATLVATLLFSTRPGPLEQALAMRPFCFLLPEYTLYAAILLVLLCAAGGLDELISKTLSKKNRLAAILVTVVPCLLIFFAQLPAVSSILPKITDLSIAAGLPSPVLVISVFLALAWLSLGILPEKQKQLSLPILAALAAANSLLLVSLIPRELGEREAFNYQHNKITAQLQTLKGRLIATGYNLFQPNTNLIYGIDDFRSTAPLYPRRYADFLRLGGGGGKFCTIPEAPETLNHIFDLAGVKYIISDHVVRSAAPPANSNPGRELNESESLCLKLADGLRLEQARASYDSERRELFASSTFTLHGIAEGHYACSLAVCRPDGEVLSPIRWLNDRIEEIGQRVGAHKYLLNFSCPVSSKLAAGTELAAVIYVRDNWTGKTLGPQAGITVAHFVVGPSTRALSDRFFRRAELPGSLYLYENRTALPQTYIVHKIASVSDEAASLRALSNSKLNWNTTAIIENASESKNATLNQADAKIDERKSAGAKVEFTKVLDRSSDSVIVLCRTNSPAWIVLTDTFFPGWVAEVDGKLATIYPANHMFRAVHVQPGRHTIGFYYRPCSFAWGCNLLGLSLLFSFCSLAYYYGSAQKRRILEQGRMPAGIHLKRPAVF